LPIEYLIRVICVLDPVEDIEWKILSHCLDHRVSLLVPIDEFSLIPRTDIESATITDDSLFGIVDVSVDYITDGYLSELDLHKKKRLRVKFFVADNDTRVGYVNYTIYNHI
jgi:hypothetical protein